MKLSDIQSRVPSGAQSQKLIAHSILGSTELPTRVLRYAPKGNKGADIIMKVGDVKIQIEAKTRVLRSSPIVVIDETVKRGDTGTQVMPLLTHLGIESGLTTFVDKARANNKTVGFAGDEGAPRGGSLGGTTTITDPAACDQARHQFIEKLQQHGDNYFAIYTQRTEQVEVYFTGLGPNVLNAPPIPLIRSLTFDTYGSAKTIGTIRVGVKAVFV